ncbi:hypothetical protein VTH82DRAFT_6435 [Thermothelomyces myriococcoides]
MVDMLMRSPSFQECLAFLRHLFLRILFLRGLKSKFAVACLLLVLLIPTSLTYYRFCTYDDFYVPTRVFCRRHPHENYKNDHHDHHHCHHHHHHHQHGNNDDDGGGWWTEFFGCLESTRVTARSVKVNGPGPSINWKPGTNATRPDLIELSEDDLARFRASHAAFIDQLAEFADRLPYEANTTGIVTTTGVATFGQAVSLVLTARRAGSRLPIQIFLDSSAPWVDWLCTETMPQFDARCVSLEDTWGGVEGAVPELVRFQWKVVSIIGSSFQNVLFLDADCLPVRSPDAIFDHGSEPFWSAGMITWPDFWVTNTSPLFYRVVASHDEHDLDIPPVWGRASPESGVMAFDKARHADTLLLAAYYNFNGPRHYYPIFSQRGAGEGDRESFLQAALVLQALRKKGVYRPPPTTLRKKGSYPYYDVKELPLCARPHGEEGLEGHVHDAAGPHERKKKKKRAKKKKESEEPPGEDEFLVNTTALDTFGPLTPALERQKAKASGGSAERRRQDHIMFFHHNGVDPDFTRLVDRHSGLVETDEDGRYVRLWGDPGWIVESLGRDAERLLWEDSMAVYCQPGLVARFDRLRRVCERMRVIHRQVYI